MTHRDLSEVYLPVEEFLKGRNQGRVKDPVCVPRNATLFETARLTIERRIHRVWVVEPNGIPIGVVSLTDILKCFST